jgi:hypothetical protein
VLCPRPVLALCWRNWCDFCLPSPFWTPTTVWFTISGVPSILVRLACNRDSFLYTSMLVFYIMHVRVPLWFVSVPHSLFIPSRSLSKIVFILIFILFFLFFFSLWKHVRRLFAVLACVYPINIFTHCSLIFRYILHFEPRSRVSSVLRIVYSFFSFFILFFCYYSWLRNEGVAIAGCTPLRSGEYGAVYHQQTSPNIRPTLLVNRP